MNNEKKIINKKVVLGLLSILACAAIVVITSFFPFVFDPERISSKEFWSNELIVLAIVIFSMTSTIFIGQSSNASNPMSQIAKTRTEFFASIKTIHNINYFYQWVKSVLQPKDIETVKQRILRECGVTDYSILDLDVTEIKQLLNQPQKINGKVYSSLNQEQLDTVLYIKNGKLKIRLVEPTYYLTVSSIHSDLTITEKSGRENQKKTLILTINITFKLLLTLFYALVFASLVKDTLTEVDKVTAWMNFASRMSALISSSTVGYRIGSEINDIDADYIRMRISVHKQYLQDDSFIPKTEEELALEKYNEIHQEEIENDRRKEEGFDILG